MTHRDVTVHVLYGIPCVGKSTGAIAFASHENIRAVVHTDYIREVQRGYVPRETVPVLAKVTHDAWELYGPPTPHNILTGFLDHVEAVARAIDMVVRKLVSDEFDAVVEGAHFSAKILEDLRNDNSRADVRATLLVVRSAEDLRQRVLRKGRERASGVPLQEWHENITAMLTIQDYLIRDAHAHDIKVRTASEWRNSWSPATVRHST